MIQSDFSIYLESHRSVNTPDILEMKMELYYEEKINNKLRETIL